MTVRTFRGKTPRLGQRVYVAEGAAIIGDVEIGDDSSIWYGAVLRGDIDAIRIGSRTNIQDNCVLHVTGGVHRTTVEDEVTIGHAAVVGEQALVAAGAVVSEGMQVPPRTLVAGVPARIKRELTADELVRLEESWKHYVDVKEEYLKG